MANYYTDAGEFEVDLPDEPRTDEHRGPSTIEEAPGVSLVSVSGLVTYDVLVYELDDPVAAARAASSLNDALERSIRSRLVRHWRSPNPRSERAGTQYRFALQAGTTTLIRLGAVGSQIVQLTVHRRSWRRLGRSGAVLRFLAS